MVINNNLQEDNKMWTRAELKKRAKVVLKGSYWKAFLVSIVILIVGGNTGSYFNSNWRLDNNRSRSFTDAFNHSFSYAYPVLLITITIVVILLILAAIAFRIFVGYALEVGGRRYFIRSAQNEVNMNYLGYAFEKGNYIDVIKSMLWRTIFNILWSLLFIIPGIVKAYAYMMVPYILADNPNIGYKRALELSMKMTDGHKSDMWVLDLSFIGWYLLGTIALYIGTLFVHPYVNATKAELYLVLRQNALDSGYCTPEELHLLKPEL